MAPDGFLRCIVLSKEVVSNLLEVFHQELMQDDERLYTDVQDIIVEQISVYYTEQAITEEIMSLGDNSVERIEEALIEFNEYLDAVTSNLPAEHVEDHRFIFQHKGLTLSGRFKHPILLLLEGQHYA